MRRLFSLSSQNVWAAHYYIQDYQGSNRMVVNRTATSATAAEQVTHYYPYGPRSHRESIFMLSARRRGFSRGQVIGDISTQESTQKYKFEGKELDRSFGLDNYDIHARNYYAMLPMWDRVDPLAEKYYGISPYVYCGGDPINKGDYDGRKIEITAPKGKLVDYKAKFQKALVYLREIGASSIIDDIINDDSYTIRINPTGYSNQTSGYEKGVIFWNPDYAIVTDLGYVMSPAEALVHEADHARDDQRNHAEHQKRRYTPDTNYKNKEERRVIQGSEQETAKKTGKGLPKEGVTRKNHASIDKFKVSDPTSSTKIE